MLERKPRKSTSTMANDEFSAGCDLCPPRTPRDQFAAHLHWLRDFPDQEALKKHLYATMTAKDEELRAGRLEGLLQWRRTIAEDFAQRTDMEGTPLQVWEAWALAQAQPPCATRNELHQRLGKVGLMPGLMVGAMPMAQRMRPTHGQYTNPAPAQQPRPSPDYLDVLHKAVAALAAPTDRAWALGWTKLYELGLAAPGRKLEAAAFCHLMAQQYPLDADDWRHEARIFEQEAHGNKGVVNDDTH